MFTINGEIWVVKMVYPDHPMLIMPDSNLAVGVCDDTTKTIYISKELHGSYFKEVLCHEIVHAAMYSYNVQLSYEEGELIANLIAKYGHEIIKVTDVIFKKLKRGYQ